MTSLTKFCHIYLPYLLEIAPSLNKRRRLSTLVRSVFIVIFKHFKA